MKNVSFNNFIPKYLLNPLSSDISELDQAICLLVSFVLAVLTVGLLHLGVAISQWNLTKVERQASNLQSISEHRGPRLPTSRHRKKNNQLRIPPNVANRIPPNVANRISHRMLEDFRRNNPDPDLVDCFSGTMLHTIAKMGREFDQFGELDQFLARCYNKNFNFNRQDVHGNTPLLWAIANAENTTALKILDYEQDLNLKGYGNTALHLAIAKGYKKISMYKDKLAISNLQLVQKIIEKGADVHVFNKNGCTPLHLACIRRDPEMIDALLRAKANPTIRTKSNESNISNKDCRALIEMSYQEAKSAIDKVTGANLLPEEEFEKNKEACLKRIGSH